MTDIIYNLDKARKLLLNGADDDISFTEDELKEVSANLIDAAIADIENFMKYKILTLNDFQKACERTMQFK